MAGRTTDKKNNKKIVGGWNVYLSKDNQTIMYDSFSKNGYVILDKDTNNFTLYHNRLALSIALAMILISFMNDWKWPLLAGVVFYAVLEIRYRKFWLPTLVCIPNFKPKQKRGFIDGLVKANNPSRFILLAILYLTFGILMVVNGYQMNSSVTILVCDYAVLAACIYLAVCYVIAIVRIRNQKK